jgi:hypothetical protein
MKNSKAYILLKGIPPKKLKQLSESIKTHKRQSLKKLFHALAGTIKNQEPGTAEIFKTVYGKKYTKQQDYLLRNEYRLLYEWLTDQLCHEQNLSAKQRETAQLRFFLQHRMYDLFEEEHKSAWKRAVQNDDEQWLLELSNLNIEYHLTGKTQSLANAETIVELTQQRINLLKTNFLREIRKEEIRLKMGERIISAYKPLNTGSEPLNTISLNELQENDLLAQYLATRAKVNFSKGKEKIELLNSILANEAIIRKYESAPEEALCRFLTNLAQEYYLSSAFTEAVSYYQKAYEHFHAIPLHVQETLVLNYVMALMRNEQFEQARQLALKHQQLLLNSKLLAGRSPFLMAVIYLHVRDADNAEKFVQLEVRKEGTEFYYFMRLVLSAVYYLRGHLDLATREAINIDQAVNYEMNREQTMQTKISKPIVSVFRRFYTIVQSRTKDKRKDELLQLQTEINRSLQANNDQSPNSVLTQWLNKEIDAVVCGG